jgi:hypothetical protein
MDHRVFGLARIVLVVLAIGVVTSVEPLAYVQVPASPAGSGSLLDKSLPDPAFAPTSPPVSVPDPVLTSGTSTPLALEALSSDDRDNSTCTDWVILAHQTPWQVTDTINAGYRLVDIYVESFSPSHLFTGVYVANTGAYAKSWWWYYGLTEAALEDALEDHDARLISLKAYDTGSGQIRFTAVMISNTGADARIWWWYYNATPANITDLIDEQEEEVRLTQINAYQTNGVTLYAVVMVDNTGDDGKAWWWYYDIPLEALSSAIGENNARLVDMDIHPVTGNLNAITNSCPSGCPYWWWYVNVPEDQVLDMANQHGARVIDVSDFPGCGSTCYDVILISNCSHQIYVPLVLR